MEIRKISFGVSNLITLDDLLAPWDTFQKNARDNSTLPIMGSIVSLCDERASGFNSVITRKFGIQNKNSLKKWPCSFCGNDMDILKDQSWRRATYGYRAALSCRYCGFWMVRQWDSIAHGTWAAPAVADFSDNYFQPAYTQLINEINKNPEKIQSLSSRNFEIFVGSVIGSYYNCVVHHVGKSHDGGIDLICIESDQPRLVQVKRRMKLGKSEGLNIVKQLFATMFGEGTHKGTIVTSAARFSKDASEWVKRNSISTAGYSIDLISLDRLLRCVKENTENISDYSCLLSYDVISGNRFSGKKFETTKEISICHDIKSAVIVFRSDHFIILRLEWCKITKILVFSSKDRHRFWICQPDDRISLQIVRSGEDKNNFMEKNEIYGELDHCNNISGADFVGLISVLSADVRSEIESLWGYVKVDGNW